MDARRAMALLEEFFSGQKVPWAIVGGFALGAYGIVRATYDLDIVVPWNVQDRLVPFLDSLGYQTLHVSQAFSHHHPSSGSLPRIDVLYVQAETAAKLFGRAEVREVLPGLAALVPRPEHLIAMKVQAMKADPERAAHELADLQELLRLPDLDREEVRSYFVRHGCEAELHALQARLGFDQPGE